MDKPTRDPYLAETRAKIAKHGWIIQGVFPTVDHPGPMFAYTVGLAALGHPELIVFGLSFETAGTILNGLGNRIRDGARLQVGQRLGDIVVGYEIEVLAVTDNHQLGVARGIYGPGVRALQLVYPDAESRFPWDRDCAPYVASLPLLGQRLGGGP